MNESKRSSRWVALKEYDYTASDEFLEVTEWTNSEGFDLHLSRGHQCISLSWNEFSALQAALGDWVDQSDPDAACPHIVTSDEGTSYCRLAEKTAELLAKLRDPAFSAERQKREG